MVRRAHIESGKVVNISIVTELSEGEIDGTNARIGDDYVDGQFITPAYVAPVPVEVLPRQFRRALRQTGLRDAVEAAVAAADEETRDTWEYAVTIERDHPMLIAMATALDVTSEQLDELFRLSSTF